MHFLTSMRWGGVVKGSGFLLDLNNEILCQSLHRKEKQGERELKGARDPEEQ